MQRLCTESSCSYLGRAEGTARGVFVVNFQTVHWMNKGPGVSADGLPTTSEVPNTRNTPRASRSNARRKPSAVSRGRSSRGHTAKGRTGNDKVAA